MAQWKINQGVVNISIVAVFIICVSLGFWIAAHKPLWNDEFYSLVLNMANKSYLQMMAGEISEGNNAPLFYMIQKAFYQACQYHVPSDWIEGKWGTSDMYSQLLLRTNPILFMSLSITLVFAYFARRYSLWSAWYSVFIYSSSYMLWVYWAEARPYALLVFLVTVQSLLFLRFIKDKDTSASTFWLMVGVHEALALTSVLSVGTIGSFSLILLLYRIQGIRGFMLLTIVPWLTAVFYYAHAPKYNFSFVFTAEQLIRDNISRDKFYIFFLFLFLLAVYVWRTYLKKSDPWLKRDILDPVPFFLCVAASLLATIIFLHIFSLSALPHGGGFVIMNRYFIYLMPLGIILTTLCSIHALRSLDHSRFFQVGIGLGIAALVVPRFMRIVPKAIQSVVGSG